MSRRPAVLVTVGVAVFVVGASLVLVSLHSGKASASSRGRSAVAAAGAGSTPVDPGPPSEVAVAAGHQAVAVTPATGPAGLAAYLGAGDVVDVYASITKLSTTTSGSGVSGVPNRPVPCTVLVAADVPVIDVSVQAPEYKEHPSSSGRNLPSTVTVLLSATNDQAPAIVFAAANESLYLTEVDGPKAPAPAGTCFDTGSALAGGAR